MRKNGEAARWDSKGFNPLAGGVRGGAEPP